MKEPEYDKSQWAKGPWDDEPNRVEWRSQGLPCLIVRSSLGHLCGYVGVPEGHPWFGKEYDQVDAKVHGGLTYSNSCEGNSFICYVPRPGEPDNVWWFGFDCAHLGDVSPGSFHRMKGWDETYKTTHYVTAEVESLAKQAALARGET